MSELSTPDVRPGRLAPDEYPLNFADASPRMGASEAVLEASRCLYCYDAPCMQACPTGINVPSFIYRIAESNPRGAARAILEANPLGGMCARVCPTETLCEQVCVRNVQEGAPVAIGRLQRYAVDTLMESDKPQLFTRAPSTGKKVAVVGAGPAGLACAHMLARHGHDVTIFDAKDKAGGLNEYGLAAYKTADDFAQREVAWLLGIGGMTVKTGWKLDSIDRFKSLQAGFDALFLGLGLAATNGLNVPGETLAGVQDAVDFIAALRQAKDLATLPVGRRVVVIGGGMTAVDAAVQSKLLGAELVSMAYRRGPEKLSASKDEQQWAQTHGVLIRCHLTPVEILGNEGHVSGVTFAKPDGSVEIIEADMVLKAIGQKLGNPLLAEIGIAMKDGRIATGDDGRTSVAGVWAGGDCRAGGLDLTVEAVEHGKRAALAIHASLA